MTNRFIDIEEDTYINTKDIQEIKVIDMTDNKKYQYIRITTNHQVYKINDEKYSLKTQLKHLLEKLNS